MALVIRHPLFLLIPSILILILSSASTFPLLNLTEETLACVFEQMSPLSAALCALTSRKLLAKVPLLLPPLSLSLLLHLSFTDLSSSSFVLKLLFLPSPPLPSPPSLSSLSFPSVRQQAPAHLQAHPDRLRGGRPRAGEVPPGLVHLPSLH